MLLSTLQMASVFESLALRLALAGDGVRRFAGLGDQQGQRLRIHQRVAVAEFRGVMHFHRHARQALDHHFSRQARMARGPGGDNPDFLERAEILLADFHFIQENLAGLGRDSSQRGVAHGARLLVNFLQREVLEAALLRQDGVPGDVLHAPRDGMAVEIATRSRRWE